MANVKLEWGTTTDLTITLASLATATARESTAVDNTSDKFEDAEVYLAIKLAAGSPGSDKAIYIYAYGSADGTNYTDNATGSNAAITLRAPSNLRLIGAISTPDSGALTYKIVLGSVAAAFGGLLPPKWGIVVQNVTNLAFDSTEGNIIKKYRGIYHTVS
jgi:hypothetical protein